MQEQSEIEEKGDDRVWLLAQSSQLPVLLLRARFSAPTLLYTFTKPSSFEKPEP